MKLYACMTLLAICTIIMGCGDSAAQGTAEKEISVAEKQESMGASTEKAVDEKKSKQNDLGAFSPEAAFEYMKEKPNLLIVDAAATRWYQTKTFEGAVNIPVEELSNTELTEAVKKLPAGQPILVHCRHGMVAPQVYRRIKEIRPDVPEISWLDGAPLFDEYNAWVRDTPVNRMR